MQPCYGRPRACAYLGSSGEIVVPLDTNFNLSSHLAHGEVRVDNTGHPCYLEVWIKASKTDPGVPMFLSTTGGDMCPVAAILSYMVLRGQESGPSSSLSMATY